MRPPTTAPSYLSYASLLALAACGAASAPSTHGGPSSPAHAQSAISEAEAETDATGASSEPAGVVVTLLDPGLRPLQALRYLYIAGHHVESTMDYMAESAMGPAADSMFVQPPAHLVLPYSTTTRQVRPDGAGVLVSEPGQPMFVFSADTAPTVRRAADAVLVGFDRIEISSILGAHGEVLEQTMYVPDDVPPGVAVSLRETAKAMSTLSAPLPREPIGVGARWVVRRSIPVQGAMIDQSTTITLDAIDADIMRLSLVLTQTAAQQRIAMPDLPADTTAWLETCDGSGHGTLAIGRDGTLRSATMETVSRLRFLVQTGEETRALYTWNRVATGIE